MLKKVKKIKYLAKGILNYNFFRYLKPLSPTELQINVTYQCNSRCQMCHIWQMKPKNEMTLKEWQEIMRDPIFREIRRLNLAGGEPLLCSDIVKLVQLYIDSMPNLENIDFLTNGLLTDKTVETVKKLSLILNQKRINFAISVSLDGLGPTHDRIRGIKKAFAKTSATILALKSIQNTYGFWLSAAGVVFHENIKTIKKVEEWCRKHDIPFHYQIIGFHKNYINNLETKNQLDFKGEDKKNLLTLLKKNTSQKFRKDLRSFLQTYYWQDLVSMYKGNLRTTPCPFALDAFVLDSFGDVYYCLSEAKIGNCRSGKSVSEIYYDPNNLRLRQQRAKTICLRCNSGCMVISGLAKDFKKSVWYFLTGRLGPAGVY